MSEQQRGRPPKRERKKQARDARRQAWEAAMRKRRRQRWGVLLASLAVVGAGLLIAFVVMDGPEDQASDTTPAPSAAAAPCPERVPDAAASEKETYDEPEDQDLDPDKTTIWRLETTCGDIDVELDVERAPQTSNSVAFLTRERFYDGLFFHRINESFVIQGGDPDGTGGGGPGYDVEEAPPADLKYEPGIVAMAKAGTDPDGTSGSQFFIVTGDEGEVLPPQYALLGKVVDGMDVVDKIDRTGSVEDGPPTVKTYIERATIIERE